jgi:glycosyltransferase involved in cell wall biosynthesis
MTPRVSVVVPSYNHARFVEACVRSALAQTFADLEVVVSDDASTDDTLAVLGAIRDPRLVVHPSAENLGVSANLNRAIGEARGELVAVLDSDNLFLPEKIARQVAFLDAHPRVAAVFTLAEFIDDAGEPFRGQSRLAELYRAEHHDPPRWLRRFFLKGNCLCHPSVVIRREALERVGLYDPRFHQMNDLELWTRLCRAGHRIAVLDERLVRFRIHGEGGNVSAASPAAARRTRWESWRLLAHYADLPEELLYRVFPECAEGPADEPPRVRLARLVLERVRHPAYAQFALEILYAEAGRTGDPRIAKALVRATGEAEVFAPPAPGARS